MILRAPPRGFLGRDNAGERRLFSGAARKLYRKLQGHSFGKSVIALGWNVCAEAAKSPTLL